jgi:hypothetical protein
MAQLTRLVAVAVELLQLAQTPLFELVEMVALVQPTQLLVQQQSHTRLVQLATWEQLLSRVLQRVLHSHQLLMESTAHQQQQRVGLM